MGVDPAKESQNLDIACGRLKRENSSENPKIVIAILLLRSLGNHESRTIALPAVIVNTKNKKTTT